MTRTIKSPLLPMEARVEPELPSGAGWLYEPKWDGFRCIVVRSGDTVMLQSKAGKSLTRYFPELVEACQKLPAKTFILDTEIVIWTKNTASFNALLQRIHPAQSRIIKLSEDTPAVFMVFDLLVDEKGRDLLNLPLSRRKEKLEHFFSTYLRQQKTFRLSQTTTNFKKAEKWLRTGLHCCDGVVAKRLELPYQSGNRLGMVKVKRLRTVDCVVGGFRYASQKSIVGSLLLGLYDNKKLLHHVGFVTASKNIGELRSLTKKLEALISPPGFTGQAPGGPSRWSTERSTDWQPLKPILVCEVRYDHFSDSRFRHGTKFERWRPDKAPTQCTFNQVNS